MAGYQYRYVSTIAGPRLRLEYIYEYHRMEPFTAEETERLIKGIDVITSYVTSYVASYVTYPIKALKAYFGF